MGIDRKVLMEKLNGMQKAERVKMRFAKAEGLLEAMQVVKEAPDMDGSAGPGWVNALLETPADGEAVLCVKQRKDGVKGLAIGHCFEGKWVVMGGCAVVAWMPLPDMPEE